MTDEQLFNIKGRLLEYNAPVAVPEDYDPHCTCGSLIPECRPCRVVTSAVLRKREIYGRQAPQDVADLIAEVERLRAA
jgi:hypothetical protein